MTATLQASGRKPVKSHGALITFLLTLKEIIHPSWIEWKRDGRNVRVLMPAAAQQGLLARLLHRPLKPGMKDFWYTVYYPTVFWAAATPRDRARFFGQIAYKSLVGYWVQKVGYRFFVVGYYGSWQNQGTKPGFDNPFLWIYPILHLVHVKTGVTPDHFYPWYEAYRHFSMRDAIELSIRGAFFWIGFTNPTSMKRQIGKYSIVERILRFFRVVPTELQQGLTRWWQAIFVFPAMYITSLVVLTLVFLVYEGVALLLPGQYVMLMTGYGLKIAATIAATAAARYAVEKIAVDVNVLLVDAANDRGWTMHFPVPATLRSLQNSRLVPDIKGSQKWLFWVIGVLCVFFFITWQVGGFILANRFGWLKTHTLFSWEGVHLLTHYWV